MPPTRHPMVNRLTSSIDEALVNLALLSQDAEVEQERTLFDLEQIFIQFRNYIEKYYHQYEYDIKSTYSSYDQHLYELKLRLKQVREKIIQSFTPTRNFKHDNEDYIFDINKYRYLEMLTTQVLNQTMDEQKSIPKYRIKLNNLDKLHDIFSMECESKPSSMASEIDRIDSYTDLIPSKRSMSIG